VDLKRSETRIAFNQGLFLESIKIYQEFQRSSVFSCDSLFHLIFYESDESWIKEVFLLKSSQKQPELEKSNKSPCIVFFNSQNSLIDFSDKKSLHSFLNTFK